MIWLFRKTLNINNIAAKASIFFNFYHNIFFGFAFSSKPKISKMSYLLLIIINIGGSLHWKLIPFWNKFLLGGAPWIKTSQELQMLFSVKIIHHPPCQTSWRENATLNQTSPWLSRKPPNQTILSTSAPPQGQTSSRRAPWGSFITYIVSNRD